MSESTGRADRSFFVRAEQGRRNCVLCRNILILTFLLKVFDKKDYSVIIIDTLIGTVVLQTAVNQIEYLI